MFQLRADGDARCFGALGGSVTVELPNPNEATGSIGFKQIELVMVTGRDGCVE